MERPTRRAATAAGANGTSSASHSNASGSGHGSHSSHSNGRNSHSNSNSTSSRRRRRESDRGSAGAGDAASASDGADTDSSSVAVEMGTTTTTRLSKGKKGRAASTQRGSVVEAEGHGEAEDPAIEAHGVAKALLDAVAGGAAEEEEEEEEEEEAPTGYATRARRERSQSVVSTTSDTSSIASEHPEEPLRPELHDEKLQELEKKKKMVEEGTLAEYCRRVAEFKEERNRLLQTAEWHKNLQVKNTQDLYGFEVQRAHNIWQDTKDKIKDSMLAKADALLVQLKQEMEVLNKTDQLPIHVVAAKKTLIQPPAKLSKSIAAPAAPIPTPATDEEPEPSASPDSVDATPQAPPSLKRRKVSAPVPDNVVRLPLDDITSDLASILQARDSASAKLHADLPAPRLEVRVDRRRLLCGKYVFEEGDEVVVTTPVLKEDYIGVISSVSDVELYVKLSTGQKVRVTVDHVALRRCEIRPFLRGSAGIESLQSSGWVECEPF